MIDTCLNVQGSKTHDPVAEAYTSLFFQGALVGQIFRTHCKVIVSCQAAKPELNDRHMPLVRRYNLSPACGLV